MSRGSECAQIDEQVGVYAVGQAVNFLALNAVWSAPKGADSDKVYASARDGVADELAFALEHMTQVYYKPRKVKETSKELENDLYAWLGGLGLSHEHKCSFITAIDRYIDAKIQEYHKV